MNIYFVVEGTSSERKVYPKWLSYLVPKLKRVNNFDIVEHNNYYLFDSGGYPAILDDTEDAITNVNNTGKYDYLVVCLDADESSVEDRIKEVEDISINLTKEELIIIVQNRCVETWFLGNREIYTRQPANHSFIKYNKFYNVSENDPELMRKSSNFKGSIAAFHEEYLKEMLREKHLKYSKRNPKTVCEPLYIERLQSRVEETKHLRTLKKFFDFCHNINEFTLKS